MKNRIKSIITILFTLGMIVLVVDSCQWRDECRAAGGVPATTRMGRTLVVRCQFPTK